MSNNPQPALPQSEIVVAALYKFSLLPDYEALREPLLKACLDAGIKGSLLLAREGINGTVAGSQNGIDALQAAIREILGIEELEYKESFAATNPFYRMKVRLKKEIVTMGVDGIDPNDTVGTYVEPEDWNALISDPDTILIDTRNDYEVGIGTFEGAIDPHTATFREFPDWFKALPEADLEGKKVAMFCTGGIRCEKATAFVRQQGIDDVYHLKGGILKYLETVPEETSLWKGECFVFDQRVSVKHGLELGSYDLCHACRSPLSDADKNADSYVPGVSCPKCHNKTDAKRKTLRFQERQRQMELAEKSGKAHIGQVLTPNTKTEAPLPESVEDLPVLYSFRRCPYAMRARMALSVTKRVCALREVALKDKPAAFLETSPKATVPVLALPDGNVLEESLEIMLWTLEQDDPEAWLTPEQDGRDEMMALISVSDGDFKHHLDRYKYATRYAEGTDPISHRAKGAQFLEALEARLQNTRYLFGNRACLADIAIFPFVRQFANTDRDWFDAQPLPSLQTWLNEFLESERFQSVMKKEPVWHPDAPVTLFPR